MSKSAAVTSGTGYVAGFVIAEFLNHGYTVRASVRSLSKTGAVKIGQMFICSKTMVFHGRGDYASELFYTHTLLQREQTIGARPIFPLSHADIASP